MLESACFDGDSCIAATGKQISSGCPVTLKFFVDDEQFVHLKKFHQQARDTSFIPGKLFACLLSEVLLVLLVLLGTIQQTSHVCYLPSKEQWLACRRAPL